jgi:hypothetical protein
MISSRLVVKLTLAELKRKTSLLVNKSLLFINISERVVLIIFLYCLDPIPELIPEKVEEKPEEPSEDDLLPPELKALIEKNKDVFN